MADRSERIYQLRFDQNFKPDYSAQDVTPDGFSGLRFPGQEPEPALPARIDSPLALGRFVREVEDRVSITTPGQAANIFSEQVFFPFESIRQEELWSLLLDAKNHGSYLSMVYRGNVNSSIVRPAEVFRDAILVNSMAIILAHNHPSGDPKPSPEDVQVTHTLRQAGELLGIELLDHLVIGNQRWVSMKELGLGFN